MRSVLLAKVALCFAGLSVGDVYQGGSPEDADLPKFSRLGGGWQLKMAK